ncbi:rhomboid family intramembrane serine protease [bacterium]|nr:rhomboid family intramembrane serine protease [bacterium]
MLILPIGTKSSIAFKPKLTITLIVINTLIAIITLTNTGHDKAALFKVQKEKFAQQIRLYAIENKDIEETGDDCSPEIELAITEIKNSRNLHNLETTLHKAIYMVEGGGVEDFWEFGNTLRSRSRDYYSTWSIKTADSFDKWKEYKEKEVRIAIGRTNYSFGLVPSRMDRTYTFITHIFLHGSILHLLGNMLFLWIVGCLLEDSWGRLPFLLFYLAGGAFAGLAHCLQNSSSTIPLIGASGAIAAAMGAFTVVHLTTRIKFFYFILFFIRPIFGTFYLPAFVVLPLWFFQQLALKSLANFAGGSHVAYIAHIAGFIAGLITALLFRATGFEKRFLHAKVRKKQIDAGILEDPRFNEACELMREGATIRAKKLFSKLIEERPDNTVMLRDIAMIYRENELEDESRKIGEQALKKLLLDSKNEEAAVWAKEFVLQNNNQCSSPQLLLNVGKWLMNRERYNEAYDIYSYIQQHSPLPLLSIKASIAMAELLSSGMDNTPQALTILKELKDKDLEPEWLDRINKVETTIKNSFSNRQQPVV